MARGIHNVNLDIIMHNGAVFGIDGDPTLSLQIIAVHNAVNHFLVISENAALVQQRVDQRRFTRVNVGDNRNIDNWLFFFHMFPAFFI